jgi:hypothetical protein
LAQLLISYFLSLGRAVRHEGLDPLSEEAVRHADHGHRRHLRVRGDGVLHLRGVDILAAADDREGRAVRGKGC